jgi:hypothetical protein
MSIAATAPRRFVLPLIAALLAPASVHAKDFSVSRQWLFPARAEALLEVILAFGQSCDHGCRYRTPHVTQAIVLQYQRRPDSFYVWTFVEDIENSTFFSQVSVRREPGRVHVEVRLVPAKRAAELTKATGKPHDPDFDDSVTLIDLEELLEAGRFKQTRVRFSNTLRMSGLGATFGAGVVRDRLEEDARATFASLRAVRPPAVAASPPTPPSSVPPRKP